MIDVSDIQLVIDTEHGDVHYVEHAFHGLFGEQHLVGFSFGISCHAGFSSHVDIVSARTKTVDSVCSQDLPLTCQLIGCNKDLQQRSLTKIYNEEL